MKKVITLIGAALFSALALASIDAVKERQKGFEAFKEEMGALKKIVANADANLQADFAKHAEALASASETQWSRYNELFPAGSHTGKTDALPSIWEKPEDFKAAITKNQEALALLKDAAKSSDPNQWKAAFGKVGGSCKGCHDSFKKD